MPLDKYCNDSSKRQSLWDKSFTKWFCTRQQKMEALHNTIVNVKHITGIKIETYNIVVCESSTKVLGVIIIKGEDIDVWN